MSVKIFMQYSHLHRVDGRPLPCVPDHLIPTLVEQCKAVQLRTGCTGWYHEGMKGIQWHLGDQPHGGPYADILFQGGRYMPVDVDKTVQRIQYATGRSRSDKDRVMARRKAANEAKKEYDRTNRAINLVPDFKDLLKYNLRVAENKHSKRVFPVS